MGLKLDISMSLDGFVAGPNQSLENPLGEGGERLHDWAIPTEAFQNRHGRDGGTKGVDDDIVRESFTGIGATIMGRHMFSGGSGPWEDDPNSFGWWGDEPPFHHPVFVLTHHAREPIELGETTFTFVTDGIESALKQAQNAAGDADIRLGGGGEVAQEYLAAGLVEEIGLHIAPVFLGDGVRLFEHHISAMPSKLECQRVLSSPSGVVHLRYRPGSSSKSPS